MVEAAWIQTGGPGGLEIVGSEGTICNDPKLGYVIAAPGKEPRPVGEGPARPTRVDRLIAAIEGKLTGAEIAADLACAADAVAIVQACYQSARTGAWVSVPRL
jgi:predicted dehydrogenase